jgi:hypothetical protein
MYLLQNEDLEEIYKMNNDNPPSKELMLNLLNKWPFLSYAAEYWAFHLRSLAQPNPNIIGLAHRLLGTQRNRDVLMRLIYFLTYDGACLVPGNGTELHIAAYFDLSWFVTEYIHKLVGVDGRADCGDTALVWGSEMGSTESVRLLLQAGADPNIVEYDGWSPLHWAATNGHVKICRLLLEHGACVDALDSRWATPGDWAIDRGQDLALAEIERFKGKHETSKDQAAKGEYEDLPKTSPSVGRPRRGVRTRMHWYQNALVSSSLRRKRGRWASEGEDRPRPRSALPE